MDQAKKKYVMNPERAKAFSAGFMGNTYKKIQEDDDKAKEESWVSRLKKKKD